MELRVVVDQNGGGGRMIGQTQKKQRYLVTLPELWVPPNKV